MYEYFTKWLPHTQHLICSHSAYWSGLDPPGPIFFATEHLPQKVDEQVSLAVLHKADVSLQNARGQTILFEAQLRSADYATQLLTKFGVNIAARCVVIK